MASLYSMADITYDGAAKDWAFRSRAWQDSDFKIAYLKTVMRSQDEAFLKVLNFVRDGEINETVRKFLDERTQNFDVNFQGTMLFPHRHSVEGYNLTRLEKLEGKLFSFKTVYAGESRYLEQINAHHHCPKSYISKSEP